MSYINTTVYYTVTVGSAAYPSPLTISPNGAVEPTTVGATAVFSGVAGNSVTNYGTIDGGAGVGKVDGGVGVNLSAGTLTNNSGAYINGGSGYYNGGNGVYLHGGTLTNYGTIDGGSVADVFSSISGAGVDLSAGTLINNGAINAGSNTFYGAFGAYLNGGTLINNASISGAGGHYHYGGGVYLNGGALTTSGSISGGVSGGPGGNGGVALQFGSAASTMTVDPGATFQGGIAGFASGDTIDITGLTPAQVASYFNPETYTLSTADEGTLQFTERYIGQYFTFNADPSGTGTDITLATGSGISTILSSTVTLGSQYHPSPLTITATGGVYPIYGGATGVLSNISGNSLTNHGTIQGGAGYYGAGSGGVGVSFTKTGVLTNTGSITGGTGGGSYSVSGGQGGASVTLKGGATLTNSGSITGGTGGTGVGGGVGGVGVVFQGASFTNSGSITGGMGGGVDPAYTGTGGQGGAGVSLNGRTLITSGTISGGQGGLGTVNGAAGDAVQFGSAVSTLIVEPGAVFNGLVAADASVKDVLELSGVQAGGTPIALGTQFTGFSTLDFASGAAWTVDASTGAAPSSGLTITGFTKSDTIDVTNLAPAQAAVDFNFTTHVLTAPGDGTLHFSSTGGDYFVFSGDGSTGTDITVATGPIAATLIYAVTVGSTAFPSPLTITATGGVAPGAAGATAVLSNIAGNSLTNQGTIHGGAGSNGSAGGNGGIGVNFTNGTFSNAGSITGGGGGTSTAAGVGGTGGVGVKLLSGGTLTNTGSITGGKGGAGTTTGGKGGAGVLLNGGTLTTSGTISDGAGGSGTTVGAAGDAVQFGAAASTLVVDPGAVFIGQVVANNVHDVLELSGAQLGGTAITLGTQFTNFSTLDFAATAQQWTVDATKADLTAHTLNIDGFGLSDTLDITNLAVGATLIFNPANNELTITKGATTINLQFDSSFTGDHFALKADGGSGTDVILQSGAVPTLAASGRDILNFAGDAQRASMGDRFIFNTHGFGSGPMLHTDPALAALSGHGFSANASTDYGFAHGLSIGSHA